MTAQLVSFSKKQVPRIPINKIRESAVTLRTEYDSESLEELGDSIKDRGQLQPIIVQPADKKGWFDLVIGSRRLRAAKAKGETHIASHIINRREPVELLLIALAENLHRQDLNPFEEAQGFLRLMKEFDLDLKAIAKGINKGEAYVRNRLQLLSMPEEVVEMVAEHKLPIRSVQVLARLPTGGDQVRLAKTVVQHHLSQSELHTQVRHELEESPRKDRESHELTSLKLQAKVGEFTTFLHKVSRRLNLRRMNASEKQATIKSLEELENEARTLREMIKNVSATDSPSAQWKSTHRYGDPRNHLQEWTIRDIERICADRRPTDEELSGELGRTVNAIKMMRSKMGVRRKA